MRHLTKSDLIMCILLVIIAFTMIGVTEALIENKPKMYKVEFKSEKGHVTALCDNDGIILNADADPEKWKERVVINVSTLSAGDTLQCYDLYSDAIHPEEFQVVNISQE